MGNLVWGDYDMCFPIEDLYAGRLVGSALLAVAEAPYRYGKDRTARGERRRRGPVRADRS